MVLCVSHLSIVSSASCMSLAVIVNFIVTSASYSLCLSLGFVLSSLVSFWFKSGGLLVLSPDAWHGGKGRLLYGFHGAVLPVMQPLACRRDKDLSLVFGLAGSYPLVAVDTPDISILVTVSVAVVAGSWRDGINVRSVIEDCVKDYLLAPI